MTTSNFGLAQPAFGSANWDTPVNNNFKIIDSILSKVITGPGGVFQGDWVNNTAYAVTNIVTDPADGAVYICAVGHTSATSPTTFTSDRASNPTYWTELDVSLTASEHAVQRFVGTGQASLPMTSLFAAPWSSYRFIGLITPQGTSAAYNLQFTDAGVGLTGSIPHSYYALGTGASSGLNSPGTGLAELSVVNGIATVGFMTHLDLVLEDTYAAFTYRTFNGATLTEGSGRFSVTNVDGLTLTCGSSIDYRGMLFSRNI